MAISHDKKVIHCDSCGADSPLIHVKKTNGIKYLRAAGEVGKRYGYLRVKIVTLNNNWTPANIDLCGRCYRVFMDEFLCKRWDTIERELQKKKKILKLRKSISKL